MRLAKWCWTVIPNERNFQFAPNNHYRFFFLHTVLLTIAFKLLYAFFYITLKYLHFRSRNIRIGSYLHRWRWTFWRKMMSKTNIMTSKRHPDFKHEDVLHPPRIRWKHEDGNIQKAEKGKNRGKPCREVCKKTISVAPVICVQVWYKSICLDFINI